MSTERTAMEERGKTPRQEGQEDMSSRTRYREEMKPHALSRSEENKKIKELLTEVARLNAVVEKFSQDIQRMRDDAAIKDDKIERLAALLHQEQHQHEEIVQQSTMALEDKEAQIHELRRCLEAQRIQLSTALEQHSKVGQELAQTLEKCRREWSIEREMLQSELYGYQQMIQECETREHEEVSDARKRCRSLEEEISGLRNEVESLQTANDELRNGDPDGTKRRLKAYEKELAKSREEVSDLNRKMSKVNERIEENFRRSDAEISALRIQLTDTIDERDKLVAELHATKEKAIRSRSVRSGSISSIASENAFLEKSHPVEAKVEELKFELDEERAIAQATQENLEEQLQLTRRLEIEINRLKQLTSESPARGKRPNVHTGLDVLDQIHRSVMQLEETIESARSQSAGVVAKTGSSQAAYHASSLNISLEEAKHQIENMKTVLEDSITFASTGEGSRVPNVFHRTPAGGNKRHRSLSSVGRWSLKNISSKRKSNKEMMKEEFEEMRRQLAILSQEKFSLEQCVRYLSSRCQLYQTAWKAREGGSKGHHRQVKSMSSRLRASPSGSSEIQVDVEEANHPDMTSMHSAASGSSRGGGVSDNSPRLSRSLEMKLIHKISSICEPFVTQPSSHIETVIQPRRPQEVSSYAS